MLKLLGFSVVIILYTIYYLYCHGWRLFAAGKWVNITVPSELVSLSRVRTKECKGVWKGSPITPTAIG